MDTVKLGIEALLVVFGLIVWAIRLEGKVLNLEKHQSETQKDVDAIRELQNIRESKVAEQLAQMRESLARIEGYLRLKGDDDHA